MPNPSFDPKCYDLAELFLADTSYAGNETIIAEARRRNPADHRGFHLRSR